jgi:hypothetical protein
MPELCKDVGPRKTEGRESRGLAAPAASRAKLEKHTSVVTTGSDGFNRLSPRNGFTVSFVLSPVTGLFATVVRARYRRLGANVGASGPHDFAVRVSAIRQRRRHVHRIPPHVRDDHETPLRRGGTARVVNLICPTPKAKYFCGQDWTETKSADEVICPSGKSGPLFHR